MLCSAAAYLLTLQFYLCMFAVQCLQCSDSSPSLETGDLLSAVSLFRTPTLQGSHPSDNLSTDTKEANKKES